MKILFTETQTLTNGDLSIKDFDALGEIIAFPLTTDEELVERAKDVDAIICNKTNMNEKTLKEAKNLKYIGVLATGYNNIDIPYINERGITVSNAGSYSTDAVAQHVFALLLNEYSKVAKYSDYVAAGEWKKTRVFSPFVFPAMELKDKTLGIIGYGNIGKAVAKIANAFGMKVVAFNRNPKEDDTVTFLDLDTLLKTADVVTVHCPLNKESKEMFCKETFDKMKDGAYFINTARGGVLVEEDLLAALESEKLSGAAIDVLNKEPMAEDCILWNTPNLTITPHVAWTPKETRQRLLEITLANIKGYLNGEPQNVVSKK